MTATAERTTIDLPTTMRASLLRKQGEIALETLTVPTIDDDQVLVQVAAVGVCGSE